MVEGYVCQFMEMEIKATLIEDYYNVKPVHYVLLEFQFSILMLILIIAFE